MLLDQNLLGMNMTFKEGDWVQLNYYSVVWPKKPSKLYMKNETLRVDITNIDGFTESFVAHDPENKARTGPIEAVAWLEHCYPPESEWYENEV